MKRDGVALWSHEIQSIWPVSVFVFEALLFPFRLVRCSNQGGVFESHRVGGLLCTVAPRQRATVSLFGRCVCRLLQLENVNGGDMRFKFGPSLVSLLPPLLVMCP